MDWFDVMTKFVIPTLEGGAVIVGAISAFLYWGRKAQRRENAR